MFVINFLITTVLPYVFEGLLQLQFISSKELRSVIHVLVVTYCHAHVSIQDNLHIVLRFRGSKALEFDADTAEEKYTICRLLGMILGGETANANGNVV